VNPTKDATKANFFSDLEPDPEHPGCIKHKKANKNKYYALKVNGKKMEAPVSSTSYQRRYTNRI